MPSFVCNTAARSAMRGITLIETLLAVAVGAVILIGSAVLYIVAVGGNQLDQAAQQLQSTASGIRQLYAGQPSYAGLTTNVAISARVFPPGMADTGSGTVVNPWKGAVTVNASATPTTFDITFQRVPQDACAKLVSMNTTGFGGSVERITVNGTAFSPSVAAITPDQAVAACGAAAEATIIWTLR